MKNQQLKQILIIAQKKYIKIKKIKNIFQILKYQNKNVTSNMSKYVLVENEQDELSEKVQIISTKRLTKRFS